MNDEFISISETELDKEWVEQPKLFFKYATQLADAKNKVAECKATLELNEAELAKMIRDAPEDFNMIKITEASLEACVKRQKAYQKSLQRLNNAKHDQDIVQAAVDALDHRKKALENLVHLFSMNYFSTPKASENSRDRINVAEKKAIRGKAQKRKVHLGTADDEGD